MARTLPTAPSWSYQQEITSTLLNEITTYLQFWANRPGFRAEQHTVQAIANSTNVQVTCETVIHDSDSGLSTSSPYSYVIPFAGIWDFFGGVGFAPNSTGTRYAMIWQNGVQINGAAPDQGQPATNTLYQVTAAHVPCNVGDVIALYTFQGSGATLNTSPTGGQSSWFAGRLDSLQNP